MIYASINNILKVIDSTDGLCCITFIAGVTSVAEGAWAPLADILRSFEEQKFELKSEENYKRKTITRPT